MFKELILPSVSIAGTNKDALVEQRTKTWQTLQLVYQNLSDMYPHRRDFVNRELHFLAACQIQDERMNIIAQMMREMTAEIDAFSEEPPYKLINLSL